MIALFALVACGPKVEFEISPESVELGEVSFDGEMPEGGYAGVTVLLKNAGSEAVELVLPAWDDDHLCLAGFDGQLPPVDLGEVGVGSTYQLVIGICAYLPGELTTEVATGVALETNGDPGTLTIPVSFIPVRFEAEE